MKNIREIEKNGLLWVNVTKQGEREMHDLERRFHFSKTDLKECLPPFQRPKMVNRHHYYFIVLHFPVFDRATRKVGYTEIDFFLSANALVTVHDGKLPVVEQLFNECLDDPKRRSLLFSGTAAQLFFELLTRLLEAVFPSLNHINEDINAVDSQLFHPSSEREMAAEILRLKTNVVNFRRAMQGHRSVLDRLLINAGHEMQLVSYQRYINTLRELATEIWHILENENESISAIHESNESYVNYRTSEIMKIFTIISVITFPLTLIASLFAIKAAGTPFVNNPAGFWIIFSIILALALTMVFWFKKKRWM